MILDENAPASLQWSTISTTMMFQGEKIDMDVGALVPCKKSDGICYVKNVRGQAYAILKRGLLPTGHHNSQLVWFRCFIVLFLLFVAVALLCPFAWLRVLVICQTTRLKAHSDVDSQAW